MTYKEARTQLIKLQNQIYENWTGDIELDVDAHYEALNEAIEALETKLPMKPNDVEDDYGTFDCPSCGMKIMAMEDGFLSHKFCLNCGQAIDWSET